MEEDRPFIGSNFMGVEGPNCEESNISLDLSLSLGNTNTSSSATTTTSTNYDRKGKQVVNYRESSLMCMEIKNITTTDYKGKLCIKKSISPLLSEPCDSDTETDNDISLALFLSLNQSFEVGEGSNKHHNLKPNDSFTSKKRRTMEFDSDTDDDLSLALSLSLNQRFEVGEGRNNRHNLKPNDALITSKKKDTLMGNPNRNKRSKVIETVSTELGLALDPWCIKKKLFLSDLGDNARLLLASSSVEAHVLRHWNGDQLAQIKQGLPVLVWDDDTDTEHEMKFKRWSNGANVLIQNWIPSFVKRRELKEGDEIGLYWDIINSRFNFSVLRRAPMQ